MIQIKPFVISLLLLSGVLWSGISSAQNNDSEVWTRVEMTTSLGNRLDFVGNLQLRLENNASSIKSWFPEAGLEYTLNKHFRIHALYRFSLNHRSDNSYKAFSRLNLGFRVKKSFQIFTLKYRTEYQYGIYNYLMEDFEAAGLYGKSYLRNKLTMAYKISKNWNSNISGELFYRMTEQNSMFDAFRFGLGLDYKINKMNKLKFGYLTERELNDSEPKTVHIFKIGYCFSL